MPSAKDSSLKYYSSQGTRLRIQPKTVLIVGLVFIGLVVLLHVYSKMSATKTPVTTTKDGAQANIQESTQNSQQDAKDTGQQQTTEQQTTKRQASQQQTTQQQKSQQFQTQNKPLPTNDL